MLSCSGKTISISLQSPFRAAKLGKAGCIAPTDIIYDVVGPCPAPSPAVLGPVFSLQLLSSLRFFLSMGSSHAHVHPISSYPATPRNTICLMSDYHFEVGSDEAIMALGKIGIKQSFWMSHASLSPCFPNSYSASYLVKVKAKRIRRSATPAASTGAWTLPRFGCLLTVRKLMKRSQPKHSEPSISQPLNQPLHFSLLFKVIAAAIQVHCMWMPRTTSPHDSRTPVVNVTFPLLNLPTAPHPASPAFWVRDYVTHFSNFTSSTFPSIFLHLAIYLGLETPRRPITRDYPPKVTRREGGKTISPDRREKQPQVCNYKKVETRAKNPFERHPRPVSPPDLRTGGSPPRYPRFAKRTIFNVPELDLLGRRTITDDNIRSALATGVNTIPYPNFNPYFDSSISHLPLPILHSDKSSKWDLKLSNWKGHLQTILTIIVACPTCGWNLHFPPHAEDRIIQLTSSSFHGSNQLPWDRDTNRNTKMMIEYLGIYQPKPTA
ncbi:hypothetical protein CCUS01_06371 [Colletotrichum cuscutae]|uniref:Uncharacterized protein n=1 Tax=Colletotrichum cuscutae TaxID=1209917 RepID=A0AAI9V4H8_9PEZI|nr:hypothetical protein CCUS01_06371 [Colletotrichum cuscutae]